MIRLIKHLLRSWGPNGDRPEMWTPRCREAVLDYCRIHGPAN